MDGRPVPLPRLRLSPAIAAASVLIVVLAAGAGVWLYGRHSPDTGPGHAGRALTGATQTVPASQRAPASQPADGPATAASPGPSAAPGAGGPVVITGSAAQVPGAQAIARFLDEYFSAINTHDYQAYIALLSPGAQQNLTETQFQDGFGTTTDSAETLVGVSAAADGNTAAAVDFTSIQSAAQSVNQADTCTDWQISLFLGQNGASYVIESPPTGYQASHSSCS